MTTPPTWLDWFVPSAVAVGIAWAGRAERRGNRRRDEDDRRHADLTRSLSGLSQQVAHLDECMDGVKARVEEQERKRGWCLIWPFRRW